MRRCLFALLVGLSAIAAASQGEIVGNVRVEVLSPHLVRIELKGPKGFEDRPTFHVVGREGWPGASTKRFVNQATTDVVTADWKVVIPAAPATSLAGIKIVDSHDQILYQCSGQESNSVWLPAPGSKPGAWSFEDTPRIIPSKEGLVPTDDGDPTSDWDLGNDAPDVYVFLPGGSYQTLRADFLKLTGPIEMPPLYALGYTDSKYYAYYQDEALRRIDEYRRRRIPLDTFVVDTDWRVGGSHGYTVDAHYFPDMPAFLRDAHDRHAHIMFNDHPEPKEKSALDPKELQYRLDGLGGLMIEGVDIWWYDRNWGVSLIDPAPKLRHEVWGMKLYHDMTQRTRPNQRPLIMANVDGIDNGFRNRPPNVSTHRYPVQWTGDTRSQWEFLRRGVENAVYEGVEGLNAWVNEDLGGHVGKPTPDLYIRYLQFGSLCPFMRVHCTKGQTREPWAFGPEAEKIVPEYIKMRYRLMPLFYGSARAAYEEGEPILRRLDLDYPTYPEAAANDQFLIGDSLLVAPIVGGKDAAVVPASAFPQGVRAEYFANPDLKGEPAVTRGEKAIDFDWGDGSPDAKIPNDNFSARWTGKFTVPGDHVYHLAVTSDDGCRVWIDGKLVIDKWVPQDSVTNEAAVDLGPGSTHDLKVEYMEMQGGALCRLRWQPVTKAAENSKRSCWIPPGTWVSVWDGKRISGPKTIEVSAPLDQMPMLLRDGAIIPLGPEVQWTGEKDWSSLGLDVVPGNGQFTLYEDDGSTNGYREGQFRKTPISTVEKGGALTISIGPGVGNYLGAFANRAWTIRVLASNARSVTVDGKRVKAKVVARAANQPFRTSGGEPAGTMVQIEIPASPVTAGHVVVVR
ncbi:MAG TPA: TIM-barrel domain-containing protein [Fimbriimonadaceae bacterium]|nr:TIM-barrel domain-containing protein [Fimbriimonadaceae bacterium]